MKPDHFRDVIATNALYRPGPLEGGMVDDYIQVKHGRKQAEYKHPVMKEVLEETHGVMVYQEQVMRILNRLGGIALANAYSCIKAISKKKLETIAKFREEFIDGAHAQGLSKKEAADLFGLIEKFAGYGFNKSHSTAYALIAYTTAYLKAHYPVEFMAALLTSDIPARNFKKKDSLVEHLEDCQRMKIEVRPARREPFGRRVHRRRGEDIASPSRRSRAAAARRRRPSSASASLCGPYRSLFDFCERLDPGAVNRTAVEALVKAGAMDALGRRAGCFAAIDRALQAGASAASDRRSGQMGLFGDADDEQAGPAVADLPNVPDWEPREQLAKEKEVLGFYLSSHPLAEHEKTLAAYCSHTTAAAAGLKHRTEVDARRNDLGGEILAHEEPQARQPQPLRHVRPGGRRRGSSAASSGPINSSTMANSWSPTPSASSAGRSTSGRAATRPTSSSTNCWTSRISTARCHAERLDPHLRGDARTGEARTASRDPPQPPGQ